jgi:hypothetical protein
MQQRSIYLAKLIGPVATAIGIGLLANGIVFKAMAVQFLGSNALIYLSGILTMTAGIAVILAHNVWEADWRVIITLFGWLAAIGGAVRIMVPDEVARIGFRFIDAPSLPVFAGLLILVLGLVLSYFGYADLLAPRHEQRRNARKRRAT